MTKVMDLELDLPLTPEQITGRLKQSIISPESSPRASYAGVTITGKAALLELDPDETGRLRETPFDEIDGILGARVEKAAVTIPEFITEMDRAGIASSVINHNTPERTAAIVRLYPERFIGAVTVNPYDEMKAVKELRRAVKEFGLKCYSANPLFYGLHANDKRLYPLYAKAVELKIPVIIRSTLAYRSQFALDIGEPQYIDEVAGSFPEMKLVAGLAGCHWVPEAIALARRHPNLYFSTAGYLPEYLRTPGLGWDILMHFSDATLQDRIVFASGWLNQSIPVSDIIRQTVNLPLNDSVMDKWLYLNAEKLLNK